tara:strand:- start:2321 stop:4348 length:2028 start_codon:yes stop_codon:yes gene_type:complete
MNYISTELSMLWIVGCITLSIATSYVLYSKGFFKSALWLRRFLFALRFATFFILTFLLLKPYINQFVTHKEKAIILVGVDNSSSLLANADSVYYSANFVNELNDLKAEFEEDFQVEIYAFGEQVERNPILDFKDRKTNLSDYLKEISDIYSNRNVVANVIASDGIYNSGSNPLYTNYSFNAPLYTLCLGDTIAKKDLELTSVSHNEIAYLGNSFPISTTVLSQYSKGERLEVSIYEEDVLLEKKEKLINRNDEIISFDYKISAQSVGIHNYRIEVKAVEGEQNTLNNTQNIFVDVLESKQKILLLSDISHPDIAAISKSIQCNENYELVLQNTSDFNGDFTPYSLLIAFQLSIKEPNIPTFYFIGNSSQALSLEWFRYLPSESALNEVNSYYNSFSLFSLNDKWNLWLEDLPPLYSPLAEYTFNSEHHHLFTQNILGVTTQNPIFTFSKQGKFRQAVCAVEGLWKWRLYEFLKTNNHQLFDELINKSVQFLSVKEDKRPFRLRHKKIIYENEPLIIDADLYNANYELVNSAEVSLLIKDEDENEYNFSFNKTAISYSLELNELKVGNYSYEAKVLFNGKELLNKGRFSVLPLELEKNSSQANHQILFNLSQKYGGKSFNKLQFSELKNEISVIESKNLSFQEEFQSDLINLKWIFILLFVFLTIEWFLRKRITNI